MPLPSAPRLPSHYCGHPCHYQSQTCTTAACTCDEQDRCHSSLFPVSQVEKAKPKLLQSALKSAMSDFGDKVEEELAPSSPNARRRSSVQHTAAASMRKLERDVERDEARDGGARTSIPGSMRLKIRNLISALHLRTSSRVAVDTPAVVLLPERWMLIWMMLISDPDEAMRGVARQARQILRGPAPKPSYVQPPVRSAALSLHCGVPHATPPPRAVAGLR